MNKHLDTRIDLKKSLLGVGLLLIGYLFGSLALGSGSYWHYLLAIAAATWGIKFMIRSMRK